MFEIDYEEGRVNIPWEWSDTVCGCLSPTYKQSDNTKCTTCGLISRWQLLLCGECNDLYLFQFKHHARQMVFVEGKHHKVRDKAQDGWALDKLICWNCICEKDPAVEGDVPPRFTKVPRVLRTFEEVLADELPELEDFVL